MTPEQEAAIRKRHAAKQHPAPQCAYDAHRWPCDTALVLAALDAERAGWEVVTDRVVSRLVPEILAALPMSQAERDGLALARLPVGWYVRRPSDEWEVRDSIGSRFGSGPTIEAAIAAALGDET